MTLVTLSKQHIPAHNIGRNTPAINICPISAIVMWFEIGLSHLSSIHGAYHISARLHLIRSSYIGYQWYCLRSLNNLPCEYVIISTMQDENKKHPRDRKRNQTRSQDNHPQPKALRYQRKVRYNIDQKPFRGYWYDCPKQASSSVRLAWPILVIQPPIHQHGRHEGTSHEYWYTKKEK